MQAHSAGNGHDWRCRNRQENHMIDDGSTESTYRRYGELVAEPHVHNKEILFDGRDHGHHRHV